MEDFDSPERKQHDLNDSETKLKLRKVHSFKLHFSTNQQMLQAIKQLERTNSEALDDLKIVSYQSSITDGKKAIQ